MKNIPELLFRVIRVCTVIVLISELLSLFGNMDWRFELFEHFRVQYFVSLVLASVGFMVLKKKKWALVSTIASVVNIFYFGHLFLPFYSDANSHMVKFAEINVLVSNQNYQAVEEFIINNDPDFVTLLEISKSWSDNLKVVTKKYPYIKKVTRSDNFGIMILSKFDLSKVAEKSAFDVPYYSGTIEVKNKEIFIMAVHPFPPASGELYKIRNDQFSLFQKTIKDSKSKYKVLMGDLNMTPWCRRYFSFIKGATLIDTNKGYGPKFTWPQGLLFPLGIKLDYIFHSKNIETAEFFVGDSVGSDHLPIFAKIRL
ncbi:MAG: endonuclease/exonuclease/phosphatase family protein [Bacteriovoracaceae bacterium]|jgi:endonuclease/exonuclease/phosphatase (EEP) superfamily protein YafD|nr:endonuclease/exonuclease/phosphatase family protein [Bacteriovoracaceae bacterium]